jgi:flavin-dependent dehydrogenase
VGTLTGEPFADAVVAGGGPAGCAAAIGLARAGADVLLLERERGPSPKVCGEFLSVEACAEARAFGFDPLALGAAAIDRVRVTWRGCTVESALPFAAASLSRATFDEALLRAAAAAGARVARSTRVVAIDGTRVSAQRDGVPEITRAAAIVLATGKSEIAAERRGGGHFPGALGFKMHLALEPRERDALAGSVELTLFADGYAGMQHIENGLTAFALVVRREGYARLGSWRALVAAVAAASPRVARRLDGAREVWPRPLAVSGVPYGFTYREPPGGGRPDLYRTGDQLAVIPSFTGDGLAIALVTGSCAARAIARGEPAQAFHAAMRARLATPMRLAGLLSRAIASPLGRAAVMWPARAVPPLFAFVASHTRIPR